MPEYARHRRLFPCNRFAAGCYVQRRPNMQLVFLTALLLALVGCRGSERFEAVQIGAIAIANAVTEDAN